MKICFITPYPPQKIGIGEYAKYLIDAMVNVNPSNKYYILAPFSDVVDFYGVIPNLSVIRIWRMDSFISILSSIHQLFKHILIIKPDVISLQYGTIRQYGGSIGEPFIFLMMLVKLFTRSKTSLSLHTFWYPYEAKQRVYDITGSKYLGILYSKYYQFIMKYFLRLQNVVISLVLEKGSPITKYLKSFSKKSQIVEIPHGVPGSNVKETFYDNRITDKTINLLLFGHIRSEKGYEHVIRAVSKIIDKKPALKDSINITLAGFPLTKDDWNYLKYLKKTVYATNLNSNVDFIIKYLSNTEISEIFLSSNITVLPNVRRVGPSGVLSLSIAYNVPAIAILDNKYITSKSTLPIIQLHNVNSLAEKILHIINKPSILEKLSEEIKTYKQNNSFERIAKEHFVLFEALASTDK